MLVLRGTPRQDVPGQVYRDAAMFDDVFDKQGRLLASRTTPKITSPLSSVEYNRFKHSEKERLFFFEIFLFFLSLSI